VVERTDGVPLFVEELTRALLEGGDVKLTGREIPATLHNSLMARLDRLGPAKEVIQVGAVIGSEFSYELLRAVHPIRPEDLQQALRKLADAELLYVRGIAPDATYQFKHALIRDAAYEALLKSRRKDLHLIVARTIDENFPALKEAHPEVLARHWTEAGEWEAAIAEWLRAGKTAEARSAFKEALESYQQALALLNTLPESPKRDLRELQLRLSIYSMLWVTRGPSSLETLEAAARTTAVAEKSGNLAQIVELMFTAGVSAIIALRDVSAIITLADQALSLALREGSPASLLLAHSLQIQMSLIRGDLAGVENHFAAEMKLIDDSSFRENHSGLLVQDFGTAGLNAWMLGRSDLARQRLAQMIATANVNNPYEVALSHFFAAEFRLLLREYEQAEGAAAQTLELSEKHQFAFLAAASRCILGQARAQLGRATEGVELIRQGMAGLLDVGAYLRGIFHKRFLAEAQASEGTIADALETVEQALQENADELFWPLTFGLRGELRLRQGQIELAEADFREAIALAQKMSARAWELRAAMSLARLLRDTGRRDEARSMLAEIYNWFTEGFDTADLVDAKSLLVGLGGTG
jgi:predicted ATPase